MKLTRTPDGYVVQVPADVAAALGLRDGDDVELCKSSITRIEVSEEDRRRAIETMRELARNNPLPPGYVFDREDANAR